MSPRPLDLAERPVRKRSSSVLSSTDDGEPSSKRTRWHVRFDPAPVPTYETYAPDEYERKDNDLEPETMRLRHQQMVAWHKALMARRLPRLARKYLGEGPKTLRENDLAFLKAYLAYVSPYNSMHAAMTAIVREDDEKSSKQAEQPVPETSKQEDDEQPVPETSKQEDDAQPVPKPSKQADDNQPEPETSKQADAVQPEPGASEQIDETDPMHTTVGS